MMIKEQIEEQFIAFLKTKGYSHEVILHHPSFEDKINYPNAQVLMTGDLALLDPVRKELLAVIEIRNEDDIIFGNRNFDNFLNYANAVRYDSLNPNIAFFIISPDKNNNDFQISVLTIENAFYKIEKETFPTLDQLIAGRLFILNSEKKTVEKEKVKELKDIKKRAFITSIGTIVSLLAGLTVATTFTFFISKIKPKETTELHITTVLIDSLNERISKLEHSINKVNSKFSTLDTIKNIPYYQFKNSINELKQLKQE